MSEGNTMTEEQVRAIVREEMQRHERAQPVTITIADTAKISDLIVAKTKAAMGEALSPHRRR